VVGSLVESCTVFSDANDMVAPWQKVRELILNFYWLVVIFLRNDYSASWTISSWLSIFGARVCFSIVMGQRNGVGSNLLGELVCDIKLGVKSSGIDVGNSLFDVKHFSNFSNCVSLVSSISFSHKSSSVLEGKMGSFFEIKVPHTITIFPIVIVLESNSKLFDIIPVLFDNVIEIISISCDSR